MSRRKNPEPDRWSVVAGLRRWARGAATDEAAVELLVGLGARFTDPRCLWVRPCHRPGWYWLDPDLLRACPVRTGNEVRVVALVITLLSGQPTTAQATNADRVRSGRAAA